MRFIKVHYVLSFFSLSLSLSLSPRLSFSFSISCFSYYFLHIAIKLQNQMSLTNCYIFFCLALNRRCPAAYDDEFEESSEELSRIAKGSRYDMDVEAAHAISISVRAMRKGLSASGDPRSSHSSRMRQGATIRVSLLRSSHQTTRESLSTHTD